MYYTTTVLSLLLGATTASKIVPATTTGLVEAESWGFPCCLQKRPHLNECAQVEEESPATYPTETCVAEVNAEKMCHYSASGNCNDDCSDSDDDCSECSKRNFYYILDLDKRLWNIEGELCELKDRVDEFEERPIFPGFPDPPIWPFPPGPGGPGGPGGPFPPGFFGDC